MRFAGVLRTNFVKIRVILHNMTWNWISAYESDEVTPGTTHKPNVKNNALTTQGISKPMNATAKSTNGGGFVAMTGHCLFSSMFGLVHHNIADSPTRYLNSRYMQLSHCCLTQTCLLTV